MIRSYKAKQKRAFQVSCKDADGQKSWCLGRRKCLSLEFLKFWVVTNEVKATCFPNGLSNVF